METRQQRPDQSTWSCMVSQGPLSFQLLPLILLFKGSPPSSVAWLCEHADGRSRTVGRIYEDYC